MHRGEAWDIRNTAICRSYILGEYQGKRILPIKVSLPCVDWPFCIALSKIIGEVGEILQGDF